MESRDHGAYQKSMTISQEQTRNSMLGTIYITTEGGFMHRNLIL